MNVLQFFADVICNGMLLGLGPHSTPEEVTAVLLEAQRRERARICGEKGIRWGGHPLTSAA